MALVRVVVKWLAPPSATEIVALRQLAPELADLPAGTLLKRLREAPEYEIGMFMPEKAEEIISHGKRLGLVLEMR